MMAVNSLTPNMPRFDTLQKSQHSTAYRACQLVRGHRQLRSQSCSEYEWFNSSASMFAVLSVVFTVIYVS